MEKISKIIPPSVRTTTVDLKNSGIARSGTPSFGRDQGVAAASMRNQIKNQGDVFTKASFELNELKSERSGIKDPKAQIVDNMANSFFMKKGRPDETIKPLSADEILAPDFDADLNPNTMNINAEKSKWEEDMNVKEDDMDAPEVGAHLDVVV